MPKPRYDLWVIFDSHALLLARRKRKRRCKQLASEWYSARRERCIITSSCGGVSCPLLVPNREALIQQLAKQPSSVPLPHADN